MEMDHQAMEQATSWSITSPRIFQLLSPARTVLVAGCGGGYDFLSGLPLYFALKAQGKKVLLANLSFTALKSQIADDKSQYCNSCFKVTHTTKTVENSGGYFPEFYLSRWFWEHFNEDVPVFTFDRQAGVSQVSAAYKKICSEHKVDAILLVDGGTDSLMFGTEEELGTPTEDQTSIVAVNAVKEVPQKFLVSVGFGVDSFHGVSHGLFLENVATLEKDGGYLGCFSIPKDSVEGGLYLEGYRAVSKHMQPSIVCASITDAMLGEFGNHHSTPRTKGSKLFINPLMPIYWTFELDKLVTRIPYAEELCNTSSRFEVMNVIFGHHSKLEKEKKLRQPMPLPM